MIAENITKNLEKRDLKISDLVKITKIPKSTIYGITERKSKCSTVYTLKQIANALDMTLDEIVTEPNTQDGINARMISLIKRTKKLPVDEQKNIEMMLEVAIKTIEMKIENEKT